VSRFNVNLATRPFRNNVLWWSAFVLSFLLIAGFTWYNSRWYRETAADLTTWDGKLRARESEIVALSREISGMTQTVSRMDLKALNERSAFANGIILSRLFSWSQLFDRLEKIQPENVRLRSIRPAITKEGTEVSLDAMTKDYDSLLKFEASLLDSRYFSFVYPVQESTRESQGGGEIHFNLAFGYVPEGRKEGPATGGAAGADPNAPAAQDPNGAAAPAPDVPGAPDPNAAAEGHAGAEGES